MARCTIAQAEAAIANMPGISDHQRQQFTAEVNEAKAKATALGQSEAETIANGVRERRDDLLRELCAVRDALAAAKANGDRQVMTESRRQHEALMAEVEEIERQVARVEEIESDPTAYGDSIHAKFPGTRPNFTFL